MQKELKRRIGGECGERECGEGEGGIEKEGRRNRRGWRREGRVVRRKIGEKGGCRRGWNGEGEEGGEKRGRRRRG